MEGKTPSSRRMRTSNIQLSNRKFQWIVLLMGALVLFGESVAAQGGEGRIHKTKHYEIYTELMDGQIEPKEIGKLLEAAWPLFEAFLGRAAKPEKRWKVHIYADQSAYMAAGKAGKFVASMSGQYLDRKNEIHSFWHGEGAAHTRKILLMYAWYQFRDQALELDNRDKRGSTIWEQGMAAFVSAHRWDAKKGKLAIGVPDETWAGYSLRGLRRRKDLREYRFFIEPHAGYAETWGLIHFLVHNKPEETVKLLAAVDDDAGKAWSDAFKGSEVSRKFVNQYLAWIERMQKNPDDVEFQPKKWPGIL